MTRDKYLDLREQMGEEPLEHEIPPEMRDFPEDVQKAIMIFNKLGDKVVNNVGYLGKDYTLLDKYIDAYSIKQPLIFLETLAILDAKIIENSARDMKAERDRIASKAP